jgi:hypothetical protein
MTYEETRAEIKRLTEEQVGLKAKLAERAELAARRTLQQAKADAQAWTEGRTPVVVYRAPASAGRAFIRR